MTCLRCGVPMVRHVTGQAPPPGTARLQARSLCARCHSRCQADGTLIDYPRANRSREEVLADYRVLIARYPDMTRARIADAIGMTPKALDQVLVRARKAGVSV